MGASCSGPIWWKSHREGGGRRGVSCGGEETELAVGCERCGRQNRLEASACGGCGRPLPRNVPCTECGAANSAGQRYCATCGTALSAGVRLGSPYAARAWLPGVALVSVVAVFIRLYGLGDILPGLSPVEAAFHLAALRVLDQGWIGLWSESVGGQPTGLAYILAGWMRLFGEAAVTPRLLSVVAGLATAGLLYRFCRSLFGPAPAALGSVLLALSKWHIHYSRLALPTALFPLVELAALYLLYTALGQRGDATSRRRMLYLAGATFGAGFYLHNAHFIFGAAVALLWARELLAGEETISVVARQGFTYLAAAVVVALPHLGLLATNAGEVARDVRAVAISSSPSYQELSGVTEQTRHVLASVWNTAVAMFWRRGADRIMDPVTAILAGVGLALALRSWRDRAHFFVLAVVATGLVGVALTREVGMYGRLVVVLPAVFASAGLGLDWLLGWTKGRLPDAGVYALAALVVAFVAVYNMLWYYSYPLGVDAALWG